MKTNLTLIALSLILLLACKKPGCTDTDATNYDINANSNDGSCNFTGGLVFWYNQSTSQFLIDDDANSLIFRVDGQIIGSTSTSVYWTSAPNCDQNGSVSKSVNLGHNKSKSVSYSVTDDTGWTYWSGNTTVQANTCKSLQLY